MDIKEIENIITCPITHEIFKNPVLAEDGITYEKHAILEWLKNNNTSPITQAVISKNINNNIGIKQLVDIFLLKNPDYLEKQFNFNYSFLNFNNECINYVKNKNFNKLLDYVEFDLNHNFFEKLLEHCKDENNKLIKFIRERNYKKN